MHRMEAAGDVIRLLKLTGEFEGFAESRRAERSRQCELRHAMASDGISGICDIFRAVNLVSLYSFDISRGISVIRLEIEHRDSREL